MVGRDGAPVSLADVGRDFLQRDIHFQPTFELVHAQRCLAQVHLALESEGSPLEFRGLRMRELP